MINPVSAGNPIKASDLNNHKHNASDITQGTLGIATGGTGNSSGLAVGLMDFENYPNGKVIKAGYSGSTLAASDAMYCAAWTMKDLDSNSNERHIKDLGWEKVGSLLGGGAVNAAGIYSTDDITGHKTSGEIAISARFNNNNFYMFQNSTYRGIYDNALGYIIRAGSSETPRFFGNCEGILDYNDRNHAISIGYAGDGLTADQAAYCCAYTTSRQIKDLSWGIVASYKLSPYRVNCTGISSTGNNMLIDNSNEFNFIPDSFSNDVWLNYRSVGGGTSSSTINTYRFGNGRGNNYANITCNGANFNDNVWISNGSLTVENQVSARFLKVALANTSGYYCTVMTMVSDGNYYGLCDQNLKDYNFLRTTYGGIIPRRNGGQDTCYLGTSGWPFNGVYAYGFTTVSDGRQKENVENINADLIDLLRPVSYTWKEKKDTRTHYGFIAQEVNEVCESLNMTLENNGIVSLDPEDPNEFLKRARKNNQEDSDIGELTEEDGVYSLNYIELIPFLVKKCQVLQQEINKLKQKIGD